MFWGYNKAATKSEKIVDIGVPSLLAIAIAYYLFRKELMLGEIITNLISLNNTALTFLSILAGFSIASISVLATSNSEIIRMLRDEQSDQLPESKKFDVMMIFFCASIVFQFFSIFLSLLSIIILPVIGINECVKAGIYTIAMLSVWYFILMITITISIRNLKVLYYVLISDRKQE